MFALKNSHSYHVFDAWGEFSWQRRLAEAHER